MKLTLETSGGVHLVRSYAPGELRIGETLHERSVVLTAERILPDWPPQTLEELRIEHFNPIFELEPEILLLGSGPAHRFPAAALLAHVLRRGIGCEVMSTGAACRTFNILVQERRRVAAALILHT